MQKQAATQIAANIDLGKIGQNANMMRNIKGVQANTDLESGYDGLTEMHLHTCTL